MKKAIASTLLFSLILSTTLAPSADARLFFGKKSQICFNSFSTLEAQSSSRTVQAPPKGYIIAISGMTTLIYFLSGPIGAAMTVLGSYNLIGNYFQQRKVFKAKKRQMEEVLTSQMNQVLTLGIQEEFGLVTKARINAKTGEIRWFEFTDKNGHKTKFKRKKPGIYESRHFSLNSNLGCQASAPAPRSEKEAPAESPSKKKKPADENLKKGSGGGYSLI